MRKILVLLVVGGFFAVAAPALAANGTISGTVTHATDSSGVNDLYVTMLNVDTQTSVSAQTESDGTYSKSVAPGTYTLTTGTSTAAETSVVFIKKSLSVTVASGETKSGNNFILTRRGRISGYVYASDGVTPLAAASVDLQNSADSTIGYDSVTTDASGFYVSSPQPADTTQSAIGTYRVTASKSGYFSASANVTLLADGTTVSLDIRLTAGSTVSGTVTDSAGTALANARVQITNDDFYFTRSATTDSSGAYSVTVYDQSENNGSAIGTYTVSVSKTGYVTHTVKLTIATEQASLTGQNYVLSAAGTVVGSVKNKAGEPIQAANISAVNEYGQSCYGTSDASGSYTLTGCYGSLQYTVTASKTNYISQRKYDIAVTGGSTTSNVNFVLLTGKTYSGKVVVKGTNAPIESASIELFHRNKVRTGYDNYYASTISDGTFTVRNLPSGKYRIKVTKAGYVTQIQESVTITSDVTGVKFTLVLGSSVYGRLYTGKNTGIDGVDISVYSINNGREVNYTMATTDADGFYRITGLKNGTYRLKTSSTDYVTRVVTLTIKKSNTKLTKNLKLSAAGSISGYITDKTTGLPVSAHVRVVGTSITATSDSNGYYIVDGVSPGKRRIVIISEFYNVSNRNDIAVSSGKVKTGVNVALDPK